MTQAIRDENHVTVALGVSSTDNTVTLPLQIDPATGRLKTDSSGGGYTNLTQFVDQTAWRLFYSNTDGDVVEFAFGAIGTVLTSGGASAVPVWSSAGAGDVTAGANLGNNLLIRGDGAGKGVQNSGITIDDSDNVTGMANLTATGALLSGLTASEIVITDGSKNLVSAAVATYPNLTELSYVKGVTSAIQTQIDALSGAVVLKGLWDASVGTFPGGGVAQSGWSYIVSVGGTVDGEVFVANDRIVAITDNASTTVYAANWHKLDYTDAVLSVFGRTGAVTATDGDYSQSLITGLKTSDSPQFAAVNIGAATDTTLARVSAGVIAVEGVNIVTTSSTDSLTNKRPQPRTNSTTTASTLAPDLSTANIYYRTTQTATLTVSAPIGTPVIGETIAMYIDSVGAETLTMNATYKAFGAAFPATTTAGKTLMITAQYNGTDWKTLWAELI